MAIAALLAITLDPALRMLFARMDFVHFRPRWLAWIVNQVGGRQLLPGGEAPDQPRPLRGLRAGRAASCCATRRPTIARGLADRGHDRPGLPEARPRVHAAAQRGHDPLHADDAARASRSREASRLLQTQDRILKSLPGGRARLRQGGPRRDLHRPGAVLDDGDDGRPEAAVRVAAEGPLVLVVGAGVAARRSCCAASGRTGSRGTSSIAEMDAGAADPRATNAWTMPIKARIDMLTTGVRTPIGIKIFGADLKRDRDDRLELERRSCATSRARAASSPSAWPAATSSTST